MKYSQIDLFGYRPSLLTSQFLEWGFAERKLILLLDVFDIIGRVKEALAIEKGMKAREIGPHPSD